MVHTTERGSNLSTRPLGGGDSPQHRHYPTLVSTSVWVLLSPVLEKPKNKNESYYRDAKLKELLGK